MDARQTARLVSVIFADQDLCICAQSASFDLVSARGAFAFYQRAANFEYPLPRETKVVYVLLSDFVIVTN